MGTLVSVMVPAYNASATIISTLDSVAAQTYRPIELIIINDGSTDDTGDLIKAWIARNEDPLLHVIYHVQRNMGLAASRKIGVDLSTGSILQFLDADDLLHPMKVRIAENVLTEGNVPVVVTQTKHFWDEAQIEVDLTAPPNQANWPRLFLPSACTHLWTTAGPAFKREIVLELGTAELDASSVDEEIIFHSRFKLNGCRVAYIPLVLNFYRRGHDGSMNKTSRARGRGAPAGSGEAGEAHPAKQTWCCPVPLGMVHARQILRAHLCVGQMRLGAAQEHGACLLKGNIGGRPGNVQLCWHRFRLEVR